jgi:small-conductance mechanosensitive channel
LPVSQAAGVVLAAVVVGSVLLQAAAYAIARRVVAGHHRLIAESVVRRTRRPTQLLVPLVALDAAVAVVHLPAGVASALAHALGIAVIGAVAFLAVRLTWVVDDVVLAEYPLDRPDNLRARQIHTQVHVLRRVAVVDIVVLAAAVALLSFPEVRAAGAGLLASAGLIGVVAGVAAKPTVSNVIAGLQIAISQPIRVDDVVVVEGHWGRVEQIALTYVVVRVWDLRRLVLPIAYLIEHPFENWTRQSAQILGWVHLEVDYQAPVDAIRQQLGTILASSPDWDGETWSLQVTGLGTETMQLRALMGARDSAAAWNLECEVRERLVAFLREEHPEALPRLRTQAVEPAGRADAASDPSRGRTHRPRPDRGAAVAVGPPEAASVAGGRRFRGP